MTTYAERKRRGLRPGRRKRARPVKRFPVREVTLHCLLTVRGRSDAAGFAVSVENAIDGALRDEIRRTFGHTLPTFSVEALSGTRFTITGDEILLGAISPTKTILDAARSAKKLPSRTKPREAPAVANAKATRKAPRP